MNEDALTAIFSWQTVLFGLGIFVITFVIRTIVEYFIPSSLVYTSKWGKLWNKLILVLMPVFIGAVIALIAQGYPYPDGLITLPARLIFGSVVGSFSGLLYQIVKGMLKAKLASEENTINKV